MKTKNFYTFIQSRAAFLNLIRIALLLVVMVTFQPGAAQAIDRTVCSSGCAFTTIQEAIEASSTGDTIKVAQGTYFESLSILHKGINLIGGYTPSDFSNPSTDPTKTIINATDKGTSAIFIGSAISGLSVTIENFTITGGVGQFDRSSNNGGGIRIQKVTATIRNNIIEDNSADAGGGIQITDDNNPLPHLIENNTIRNNTAKNDRGIGFGGGIDINTSATTVRGNTITGNQARCGGGMVVFASGVTIENNFIANNHASFTNPGQGCTGGDGGGLFIELVNTSPILRNNLIYDNTALRGDGINIAVGPGQPKIVNNTIANNKNSTGFDDGLFYVGTNITPILRNNIVVFNGSGIHRGDNVATPFPVISNNLVYGNEQTNYRNLSAGGGDISVDPQFVNLAGDDYHLQAGSPAIDNGTGTDAPNNDLEGQTRPLDGNGDGNAQWDIGAYEFAAWIIKTVDQAAVEPNDTLQFTIQYQNNSQDTATGVLLSDILSSALTDVSYTSSGATVTPQGGSPYTWTVQNLAPGQGGTIVITARVKDSVATPLALINTAQLSTANVGTYNSQATVIVGGLKTFLPIIIKN